MIPASLVLGLLLLMSPAGAQDSDCPTPQAALRSWQEALAGPLADPSGAVRCLDVPEELAGRGPQLAVQLQQVLEADARTLDPGSLPDEPGHLDADGRPRLTPFPDLPEIYLEAREGSWRWSRETLRSVPVLYQGRYPGVSWALQSVLPPLFFYRILGAYPWQLLYLSLLVAVALAAGRLAQRLLTTELRHLSTRFNVPVDPSVWTRTRRPITAAAISGLLVWGVPGLHLDRDLTRVLVFLLQVSVSVSVVFVAYRLVGEFERLAARWAQNTQGKMDDQVIPLLARMARVVVVVLGVLFVLQNQGVDVGSLLAGLGLGGLAVALAAKDTVENLFGSLTIFMDRPFQVGDWIVVDTDVSGEVEEVGMRSTRIRTLEKSLVSIPNGRLANSNVNNLGRRPVRRVQTTLSLPCDTPVEKIEEFTARLRAILATRKQVAQDSVEVVFHTFNASSLDLLVIFFLEVQTYHDELAARQDVFLAFLRTARESGVSFAYPTTRVIMDP